MSLIDPIGLQSIAQQGLIQTLEALEAIKSRKNNLLIGIPKEVAFQENRIALTPLSVAMLVNNGHKVVIESAAGTGSNFSDHNYSEKGAIITYDVKEVYQCDIIIKISPPTMEEVSWMQNGQTLLSTLHISLLKKEVLQALMEKKVTALCFEGLRDEGNVLSVVRAMSEIVGATSILIAAEYLSVIFGGKGLMLGGFTGVPPTEVVILGAGTVGEYAARTAIALGAEVKVFDNSIYKLRRLQNNIGNRVFTSVMQPIVLEKAITSCDVVIGALRYQEGKCPYLVMEDTVARMKANAVIVDVSIDQGGCFETSRVTNHHHPVYKIHEIIHYCVPNIASRVPRSASYALTNIFAPILKDIGENGGINNLIWNKTGIRNATYIFKGHLTSAEMSEKFQIPYKDLNLLAAANC